MEAAAGSGTWPTTPDATATATGGTKDATTVVAVLESASEITATARTQPPASRSFNTINDVPCPQMRGSHPTDYAEDATMSPVRKAYSPSMLGDTMTTPADTARNQRAILAAVLTAHVDALPTRVSSGIALAVDELTDPLFAPGYLPSTAEEVSDPRAAVRSAVTVLQDVIATGDVATALKCGRAVRELVEAQTAWPSVAA